MRAISVMMLAINLLKTNIGATTKGGRSIKVKTLFSSIFSVISFILSLGINP